MNHLGIGVEALRVEIGWDFEILVWHILKHTAFVHDCVEWWILRISHLDQAHLAVLRVGGRRGTRVIVPT